jgi:hypothetical protein
MRNRDAKFWLTLIAVILLVGLIPLKIWIHYATMETVTGLVVQDKDRVTSGSGKDMKSEYLIFTDRETFKNTDSWLALKFDSSDMYGAIQKGQTCDFKVTGFRVPFFSSYRNILEATCS